MGNDATCVGEVNKSNDIHNENTDASGAQRPSRRALHRRAVKKFEARRKNEERKRAADERDQKLFGFNDGDNNNNNNNNDGKEDSRELCSVGMPSGDSVAKPVFVNKWDFVFFFRTMPSELLQSRAEAADAGGELAPQPSALYSEQERSLVVHDDAEERPQRGSLSFKAVKQSNITRSIHVRRVEGVPPLPMTVPLQPGTDLDQPTWNYLLPDTTYNVHQYAPGFERDENAAKRLLLGCAVREWRGSGDDKVLVLSTGDALRSVFEATYCDEKPLALKVRRVGPTLLIDSHSERVLHTRVRDMREKALLGKALYRIHYASIPHRENCGVNSNDVNGCASDGVVALPVHRIGSLALLKQTRALSRYSHIYSWEIGSMDVLVGIDTPIVLDCRDNTEIVLKLEDTSVVRTPQEIQRSALRCWFDATLANVPQVGIFMHNDGIIQRYEVKKVQEMLGILEGSMATAAMNCTTNVLQWLATQCVKDGMTYAVIRNYETGFLEVYEYSRDEGLEKFLPEGGQGDEETTASIGNNGNNNGRNGASNDKKKNSDGNVSELEKAEEEEKGRAEENERLNWGLATMCFRMGMHLKDSEQRTPDAVSLLLRSFVLYFFQRSRMDEACRHLCDIAECLPGLMGRLIDNRKASLQEQGSVIQLPEVYREAFVTCGRFETRLQEAVFDETLNIPTRRAFAQSLLPCGAALCVCVSRAMEQFFEERRLYMRLRAEGNRSSNVHIHSLIAKDLLQVVVEGLLRLEQMNRLLQSDTVLAQCMCVGSSVGPMALIDTKTEILDLKPLEMTIWELYTDVVLLVMSDQTPFTANVLVELSRRIKSREENRSGSAADASIVSGTTLSWLSALTHDVVSLSFTALRFFAKIGSESKRILSKRAQMYYHVGHHYLLTDRYTKALESLYRAHSLYKAMQQTPEDVVFGGCCTFSASVTIRDVQLLLGEVYIRMAHLKSRFAPTELQPSLQQPLLMGEAQMLSQEEENFYRQAVDHFTNCEGNDRLAAALRLFASRQIGHMAYSGQQGDVAKGRHIYSMLRKAAELSKNDVALNWEVLRLCTCTVHHSALQHRAEEILSEWTRATSVAGAVHILQELRSTVHPVECTLQVALVFLSLLVSKKKLKFTQAMGFVRGCAAHVIAALHDAHVAGNTPDAPLRRAMAAWRAHCTHEWVCRVALMIGLRAMRAVLRVLPHDKSAGVKKMLQRLVELEAASERETQAKSNACEGKCGFQRLSGSLLEALQEVVRW